MIWTCQRRCNKTSELQWKPAIWSSLLPRHHHTFSSCDGGNSALEIEMPGVLWCSTTDWADPAIDGLQWLVQPKGLELSCNVLDDGRLTSKEFRHEGSFWPAELKMQEIIVSPSESCSCEEGECKGHDFACHDDCWVENNQTDDHQYIYIYMCV